MGDAGDATQALLKSHKMAKGLVRKESPRQSKEGRQCSMFTVQFPPLGLSPAHLCPGEVIHTLSLYCPSYPGPRSLLWCLTIQPLPSPKELQGAVLHLSACYPLNSCPLWLVTGPRFPPPPKITFFQNRHCPLNHQLH